MTIADELTKVREVLHDDGRLWSDEELLRYFNDGYVEFCALSGSVRRFLTFDVPPRVAWSIMYDWEDSMVEGTLRRWTRPTASYACSSLWEVEQLAGLTPSNSDYWSMHAWERAYAGGEIERHFRFTPPSTLEQVQRVTWDDRVLDQAHVEHLDRSSSRWWRQGTQPSWWLQGVGRDGTFEVYGVQTTYNEGYVHQQQATVPFSAIGETWPLLPTRGGIPRRFTGSRTWTAEVAPQSGGGTSFNLQYMVNGNKLTLTIFGGVPTVPLGILRHIRSPDRQYLPASDEETGTIQQLGIARSFRSSADSITALCSIVPRRNLTALSTPTLIPAPLVKYLRYYVLARAFSRSGEGQNFPMAGHLNMRFRRGVAFFQTLQQLTKSDISMQRETMEHGASARARRVRLPSTFEQR